MQKKPRHRLFDLIAPFYGWFFNKQKRHFREILDHPASDIGFSDHPRVLDIGCGTGAFCQVLAERGCDVTGVDVSGGMLKVAERKTTHPSVRYMHADVLEGLPFDDRSFDVVIASFVAHGMKKPDRLKLYREMGRLAETMVILHDYNDHRSPGVSLIEWLEGGDYFRFIHEIEKEMEACMQAMPDQRFDKHRVVDVASHASWYICTSSTS